MICASSGNRLGDDNKETKMSNEVYEIWLVPNGALTGFPKGMVAGCTQWDSWLTSMDEVRARFRELAEDEFRREEGGYDRAWDDTINGFDDQDSDEARSHAAAAADEALKKFCDLAAESLSIEWHDDLKWVRCRKMIEHDDGRREFVEVI